jgi:uncharacterized protein YjiS (DUF1127 family)
MSVIVPLFTRRKGGAAPGHRAETCRPAWDTGLLGWCARCWARSRQRRVLADIDRRLLADIGVTQQQAIAEADKPFWK